MKFKIGDKVRHRNMKKGKTLGVGTVIKDRHDTLTHETILVDFHDYEGKMSTRWMLPQTLETVEKKREPAIFTWFFSHFIFLPFIWIMDKLGIRP